MRSHTHAYVYTITHCKGQGKGVALQYIRYSNLSLTKDKDQNTVYIGMPSSCTVTRQLFVILPFIMYMYDFINAVIVDYIFSYKNIIYNQSGDMDNSTLYARLEFNCNSKQY